ncbi:MAG: SDR family oxidoreductase [Hyphomicrobiales bacterium]|nr:SDR family oxidoreductase [Hyphomicrobiales bacterium]
MPGVALITGGSRGIGAATARRLAVSGYDLALNYVRDADAAERLSAELSATGARTMTVKADVSSEADVETMFGAVDAKLGPLTALVNSAGITAHSPVAAFRGEDLQRLMQTNVVGTMLCCREAIRRMSTAGGGAGGAIVNVSSMAATIGGRPGSSHYAASKAAVDAFTMGLAKEVATDGIRVNAVRPGMTLTDMTSAVRDDPAARAAITSTIAMHRAAEADEIAAPIAWLLGDEASFISGCRLDASGGGFVITGNTDKNDN